MNEVVVTKISTHKKRNSAREIVHMYTVVSGKGSNRTSQTRHMTEAQASVLKKTLGGK